MTYIVSSGTLNPTIPYRLTNAIRNAYFSVTRITAAQFIVAHFIVADFTNPAKKWLPNLPLPNFLGAQYSVAHFTVAQYSVAHFTVAQFAVYRPWKTKCTFQ